MASRGPVIPSGEPFYLAPGARFGAPGCFMEPGDRFILFQCFTILAGDPIIPAADTIIGALGSPVSTFGD